MLDKFGRFLFGLITGGIVGIITALLITPKSGQKIREDLRNGFDEIKLDFELGKQKKKEELEADIKQRWGEE